MKKLMIAAAIVCAAAFAQAAAINWQSGTIYVASDAQGTTGSGTSYKAGLASSGRMVTAYLYELTLEQYTAAQAMDAAGLYDTYFKTTATATKTTLGNGAANITQSNVAAASGLHYGLVLFVDESADRVPTGKDAFVKASLATADVGGASDVTVANLIGNTTAANWTAVPVPEPTSGLLLLLGVAGMALRRRRA